MLGVSKKSSIFYKRNWTTSQSFSTYASSFLHRGFFDIKANTFSSHSAILENQTSAQDRLKTRRRVVTRTQTKSQSNRKCWRWTAQALISGPACPAAFQQNSAPAKQKIKSGRPSTPMDRNSDLKDWNLKAAGLTRESSDEDLCCQSFPAWSVCCDIFLNWCLRQVPFCHSAF